MGYLMPLPPMGIKHHNFKPLTMDIMKDMIYSEDSDLNSMTLKPFKGEITPIIEDMVENMYKLTVLAKTMGKFSESKRISHVQPYKDEKQQFRCYLASSYIVVEVTDNPAGYSGNWKHIIENHGADEKDNKRFYQFDIVPNLQDETLMTISRGIEMVIETVERHVYDCMNETNTIFEQLNMIRIGEKTRAEIKAEEKIRFEERKALEDADKQVKKEQRQAFWSRFIPTRSKITFK